MRIYIPTPVKLYIQLGRSTRGLYSPLNFKFKWEDQQGDWEYNDEDADENDDDDDDVDDVVDDVVVIVIVIVVCCCCCYIQRTGS